MCMRTSVYVYDMTNSLCVCVVRLNLKVRWNYIHTHRLSEFLWPGYGMNMEELEQKAQWHWDKVIWVDRCMCVYVCVCTPMCQRIVPGQQVASQRTSVTFSLSLPLSSSICPSLPLSPRPNSSYPAVNAVSLYNTSRAHWEDKHTHKNRCGWFIHELV